MNSYTHSDQVVICLMTWTVTVLGHVLFRCWTNLCWQTAAALPVWSCSSRRKSCSRSRSSICTGRSVSAAGGRTESHRWLNTSGEWRTISFSPNQVLIKSRWNSETQSFLSCGSGLVVSVLKESLQQWCWSTADPGSAEKRNSAAPERTTLWCHLQNQVTSLSLYIYYKLYIIVLSSWCHWLLFFEQFCLNVLAL